MTVITEKEIEIGRWLVSRGLVRSHYHSVELLANKEDIIYPVYRSGKELRYAGVDDRKSRFSYTRLTGNPSYSSDFNIGSCEKGYILSVPMRLVVFNDYEEENRQHLIQRIIGVGFMKDVKFLRYISDTSELANNESPIGDFEFDGKTFYLAVDFTVKVRLIQENCETETCFDYPNPIC